MAQPTVNNDVCIQHDCDREQVLSYGISFCPVHMVEFYRRVNRFLEDQGEETWRVHVDELVKDTNPTRRRRKAAANVATNGEGGSYVYFLLFGERIKIGFTTNLNTRFATLPWDVILGVMEGDGATERAAHVMWRKLRITGEWFKDDPELRSWIKSRPLLTADSAVMRSLVA